MKPDSSSTRRILAATLAASTASLAAAFFAQYALGLMPCHLCIAQRVPFAIVILLALVGWRKEARHNVIILLIGLAFLVNSGIAAYHASVEQHWVAGPSGCTSEGGQGGQSMDDFLNRIKNAPVVACDHPQWEFHGLTMASLNAGWCLLLSSATFVALQQARRKAAVYA